MDAPSVVEVCSFRVFPRLDGVFDISLRFADGDFYGEVILEAVNDVRSNIPRQLIGFWNEYSEGKNKSRVQFECIDPKYKSPNCKT